MKLVGTYLAITRLISLFLGRVCQAWQLMWPLARTHSWFWDYLVYLKISRWFEFKPTLVYKYPCLNEEICDFYQGLHSYDPMNKFYWNRIWNLGQTSRHHSCWQFNPYLSICKRVLYWVIISEQSFISGRP